MRQSCLDQEQHSVQPHTLHCGQPRPSRIPGQREHRSHLHRPRPLQRTRHGWELSRPPLSKEEREQELATLANWGIRNRAEAARAGIEWPDGENGAAKFQDIWRWEDDVHEEWVKKIEGGKYEGLARTIEATRLSHGEDTAAYLTYMAIRLMEMHRVLKSTGSIYLHCDPTASHYLKATLDAVFGRKQFRNEIVWAYPPGRGWPQTRLPPEARYDSLLR